MVLGDEDVLLENIDLHAQHPSADAASQEATTQQALAKYPLHSSFAALRVLRQGVRQGQFLTRCCVWMGVARYKGWLNGHHDVVPVLAIDLLVATHVSTHA